MESNSKAYVRVYLVKDRKFFPQLFYILYQFPTILRIINLHFKNYTDIYYFRYTPFLFIPMFLKILGLNRIYLEINGIPNQDLLEKRKKPFIPYLRKLILFRYDKFLFRYVNYLFTVCDVFKKNIATNYSINNDIFVIPNGYFSEDIESLEAFKTKRELELDQRKKYCIYAGSLIYYEGVEFLIDAYVKFCEIPDNKDKVLLILGSGPLLNDLKLKIPSELKDNFKFIGYVPRDIMRKYIIASDVGVYTPLEVSYGEEMQRGGSALKLVDYLGCGIPVLIPKSTYYQYVINNNIGCEYNPNDISSFCNVLTIMMTDTHKLKIQGRNASEYARSTLHWKQTLSPLISILDKIN